MTTINDYAKQHAEVLAKEKALRQSKVDAATAFANEAIKVLAEDLGITLTVGAVKGYNHLFTTVTVIKEKPGILWGRTRKEIANLTITHNQDNPTVIGASLNQVVRGDILSDRARQAQGFHAERAEIGVATIEDFKRGAGRAKAEGKLVYLAQG